MGDESTGRMVKPLEVTSSGIRNPLEEWDSAEIYLLIDEKSTHGTWESARELLAHGC
jgi:hypothetical protein